MQLLHIAVHIHVWQQTTMRAHPAIQQILQWMVNGNNKIKKQKPTLKLGLNWSTFLTTM